MSQEDITEFSDDGAGLVVTSAGFTEEVREDLIEAFDGGWVDETERPGLVEICLSLAAIVRALLEIQGLEADRTVFEVESADDDGPVTDVILSNLLQLAEDAVGAQIVDELDEMFEAVRGKIHGADAPMTAARP